MSRDYRIHIERKNPMKWWGLFGVIAACVAIIWILFTRLPSDKAVVVSSSVAPHRAVPSLVSRSALAANQADAEENEIAAGLKPELLVDDLDILDLAATESLRTEGVLQLTQRIKAARSGLLSFGKQQSGLFYVYTDCVVTKDGNVLLLRSSFDELTDEISSSQELQVGGSVPLQDVLELLSELKLKSIILVLDTNHDIFDFRDSSSLVTQALASSVGDELVRSKAKNVWVLCAENQYDLNPIEPGANSSVLGTAVHEALSGKADREDGDGRVELSEFYSYVQTECFARTYGGLNVHLVGPDRDYSGENLGSLGDAAKILVSEYNPSLDETDEPDDADGEKAESTEAGEEKKPGAVSPHDLPESWRKLFSEWQALGIDQLGNPTPEARENSTVSSLSWEPVDYAPELVNDSIRTLLFYQAQLIREGDFQLGNSLSAMLIPVTQVDNNNSASGKDALSNRINDLDQMSERFSVDALNRNRDILRAFFYVRHAATLATRLTTLVPHANPRVGPKVESYLDAFGDLRTSLTRSPMANVETINANVAAVRASTSELFDVSTREKAVACLHFLLLSPTLPLDDRATLYAMLANNEPFSLPKQLRSLAKRFSVEPTDMFRAFETALEESSDDAFGIAIGLRFKTEPKSKLKAYDSDKHAQILLGLKSNPDLETAEKKIEAVVFQDLNQKVFREIPLDKSPFKVKWDYPSDTAQVKVEVVDQDQTHCKLAFQCIDYFDSKQEFTVTANIGSSTKASYQISVSPFAKGAVELHIIEERGGRSLQPITLAGDASAEVGPNTISDLVKLPVFPNRESSFGFELSHTYPHAKEFYVDLVFRGRPASARWPLNQITSQSESERSAFIAESEVLESTRLFSPKSEADRRSELSAVEGSSDGEESEDAPATQSAHIEAAEILVYDKQRVDARSSEDPPPNPVARFLCELDLQRPADYVTIQPRDSGVGFVVSLREENLPPQLNQSPVEVVLRGKNGQEPDSLLLSSSSRSQLSPLVDPNGIVATIDGTPQAWTSSQLRPEDRIVAWRALGGDETEPAWNEIQSKSGAPIIKDFGEATQIQFRLLLSSGPTGPGPDWNCTTIGIEQERSQEIFSNLDVAMSGRFTSQRVPRLRLLPRVKACEVTFDLRADRRKSVVLSRREVELDKLEIVLDSERPEITEFKTLGQDYERWSDIEVSLRIKDQSIKKVDLECVEILADGSTKPKVIYSWPTVDAPNRTEAPGPYIAFRDLKPTVFSTFSKSGTFGLTARVEDFAGHETTSEQCIFVLEPPDPKPMVVTPPAVKGKMRLTPKYGSSILNSAELTIEQLSGSPVTFEPSRGPAVITIDGATKFKVTYQAIRNGEDLVYSHEIEITERSQIMDKDVVLKVFKKK